MYLSWIGQPTESLTQDMTGILLCVNQRAKRVSAHIAFCIDVPDRQVYPNLRQIPHELQSTSTPVFDTAKQGLLRHHSAACKQVVNKVRGKLSKLERKTLSALIVVDVHARDVATELAAQGVSSETDFEWMSQLR